MLGIVYHRNTENLGDLYHFGVSYLYRALN